MRYKKPPPPFNFRELADAESEEPQIRDVLSKKSTQIAANKISDKYKKIRAKNRAELAEADTITYVDNDMDMSDVNLNINAAIAAKKISDKYKNIRRKRRLVTVIEPIKEEIPVRGQNRDRKILMEAAKKVQNKYKKMHFRY